MKKPKFKKKYVLGEGYPWALGTENHKEICIDQKSHQARQNEEEKINFVVGFCVEFF